MKGDGRFSRADMDDDEESESNWQDSYSDLMTDLLAIFVVLFSFAMMSQAVAASRTASGQKSDTVRELVVIEQTQSTGDFLPSGSSEILLAEDKLGDLLKSISIYIDEAKLSSQLSANRLLAHISDILDEFADSIKMVRIEGHTDNVPISSSHFASNWELSTSRAVTVLRHLMEMSSMKADRFSAVGYSEFHPAADNETAAGRARNRRVDFIIETSRVIEIKRLP